MSDDEISSLYVKTTCTFCLGGRRQGVFANCSYCNHERKTYIAASLKEIAKYVSSLNKEEHDKFLDLLYSGANDLNEGE